MDEEQRVSLGEVPADLVVSGGRALLPGTGEFAERDVLVVGDRVAALVEDSSDAVGEDTEVLEAEGRHVVPGFVDAHTHLDAGQAFETIYPHALAGGTTTIVTEVETFGFLVGAEGVREFLAATADLPVTVAGTVPAQPFVDTFEPPPSDEEGRERLADLLADERVVGVGEIDWIHVVGRDSPVEALADRAHREGTVVSAHGAGCSGEKLAALASVVDNDHEAISADGIVERVENGLHAIGRTGNIRDDVEAVAGAHGRVDPAELSLASDGVSPRAMLEDGYMDAILRAAIDAGVPPADAIYMVTAAPARHFGLDCGALAPGKRADVVVLADLEAVEVETVVAEGEVVVQDGEPTVGPRAHDYPPEYYDSVDVRLDEARFRVPDPGGPVRAIQNEPGLVSTETSVEPPVVDGGLGADPADDLAKATLLNRRPGGDDRGFTGFVTGFGLERGAVASTRTWELPGLLVVGVDDASMLRAARRLVEIGGGWTVDDGESVVAEFPNEVLGVCSSMPVEESIERQDAVHDALRDLGCDVEAPLLGLQTLTFPGVPSLKMSFSGYADILRREIVGLAAE